jgi:hypothetical protein
MAQRERFKHKGGTEHYLIRAKNGRITDIQNIGRTIRADTRIKSSNVPRKARQGFMGNYENYSSAKWSRNVPQKSFLNMQVSKKKSLW